MENRMNGAVSRLRRITPEMLTAFCSTLIFGLLAHGMGLFNKFSHHDDILLLFGTGTTFTSGRWMLHVLGWLEECLFGPSHYSMPLYNGVFCNFIGFGFIQTDIDFFIRLSTCNNHFLLLFSESNVKKIIVQPLSQRTVFLANIF